LRIVGILRSVEEPPGQVWAGQGSSIPDGSCGSGVPFREVDGEWPSRDEGGVKMSRKSKKRAVSFGSGETSRN
jgi:hypothetical protein